MQQMRDMNEITPSAEPSVCGCVTPFVTADFIWWKAQEDGLDFALNGTSIAGVEAGFLPETASRGTVKGPHFSYEPGFKVGAGLKFEHDGWDLLLNTLGGVRTLANTIRRAASLKTQMVHLM